MDLGTLLSKFGEFGVEMDIFQIETGVFQIKLGSLNEDYNIFLSNGI